MDSGEWPCGCGMWCLGDEGDEGDEWPKSSGWVGH